VPVRLAVLLVFDQMRGDYLGRWEKLFEKGGLRRLADDGAWFQNCHYDHADTLTGPGHAALATGCTPDRHGIILNDWYDRRAKEMVNCVGSRHPQVPPAPPRKNRKPATSASPQRLLAPTLADALKKATRGKGKVVSLSLKDRSAVLPGGREPDACYWTDRNGQFVTSRFYRDRPHAWVTRFNRSGLVDRWYGKEWQKLRPDLDYVRHSGPDDGPGEGKGTGQGRTFPHPFGNGAKPKKTSYYSALANSPMGNEWLLALVLEAIDAEQLGKDDVPDLLAVSFSSNDLVGHIWGPDSQEVLDTTLRTDRVVKELLDHLDRKVGQGRYCVVMTADHGICPLPAVTRGRGVEAGWVDFKKLSLGAECYLNETFAVKESDRKGLWIEACKEGQLYLNGPLIRRRRLKQADVEAALAKWVLKQRGVHAAYTRSQLAAGIPTGRIGQRVARSFHPARSGDVLVVLAPHYLPGDGLRGTGTTHGTPHAYDTHVPLIAFGPGIRAGARKDAVTPRCAPVILAQALGIDPPSDDAPVPAGLFR
jgi:predicted AlkP superfamily pyrophosphatase or phosphodiesterase